MGALLRSLRRNQLLISPPTLTKHGDALKFGILGAASIAPMSLIVPAKSNPNVIVYAVAARDKAKATAYAKKHGIPNVKDDYDAVLDDPAIDAVYIPLPNGLHFEWAYKALAKGKHVLLEKPSTSNAEEAEALFHSPFLSQLNAPVVMEAFHSRFTPSFALFKSVLDPPNIEHVVSKSHLPGIYFRDTDIRFNYDLAGGSLMDWGTYHVAGVREIFNAEPTECIEANLQRMKQPYDKCDGYYTAKLRFPNGGTAEIEGGLKGPNSPASWANALTPFTVIHKPVAVIDHGLDVGSEYEVKKTRTVTLRNFMFTQNYHSIDIVDDFIVIEKGSSRIVKKVTKRETKKAYTWKEMGREVLGEPWLSTYGHMLEQFVNKIRRKEGSGIFVTPEDSIAQMKAIDMIYEKSGLGLRPKSKYLANLVV